MESLTLDISGMSCSHCVGRVSTALRNVAGVEVGDVKIGSATLSYDPAKASPDEIASAVSDAGYPTHVASPRA
jgi:copper chaperone